MTVRLERLFYAVDESIFYLFGGGGVDDVIQRAHKHQVAIIGGQIRRVGPIFAGLDICEGKLLCPVLYVIEMGLNPIERVDLSPCSDKLGKFIRVVPWSTV